MEFPSIFTGLIPVYTERRPYSGSSTEQLEEMEARPFCRILTALETGPLD